MQDEKAYGLCASNVFGTLDIEGIRTELSVREIVTRRLSEGSGGPEELRERLRGYAVEVNGHALRVLFIVAASRLGGSSPLFAMSIALGEVGPIWPRIQPLELLLQTLHVFLPSNKILSFTQAKLSQARVRG